MSNYTYIKNAIKRKHRNIKRFENFKRWYKLFPVFYSVLFLIVLILIISGIVWLFANLEWFELKSKNDLGDAFGGLTNPIVAFIGVIVTFLAFYIQYTFNKEQSKLIALQRKERIDDKSKRDIEIRREQFDRKFYELLKLHSENVKEFNIDNKFFGKKAFVKMHDEFLNIYKILFLYTEAEEQKDVMNLCYYLLFHGFEVANYHKKIDSFKECSEIKCKLTEIQSLCSHYLKDRNNFKYDTNELGPIYFYYYPFDGHSHRLNHYFRHLYYLLKSIDEFTLLENDEKQDYYNIIRAQLSNYEQTLIYYNAISWFPEKWKRYIVDFKIIKNIPLEFCFLKPKPDEYFKNEIDFLKQNNIKLFSWVNLNEEN